MEYNVFIFVTNNRLLALNVNGFKECERISIDGNDSMKYRKNSDISVFVNYVKEYFNIDDFSDIDLNVNVINLMTTEENTMFLLQELTGLKSMNSQDGTMILPIVLGLNNTFKRNGEKIRCKILDVEYGIAVSEDGKINCDASEDGEKVELQPEDFCVLIQLNRENFDGLGEKYKVMYEEIKKKLQNKDQMCEELKESKSTIEEQLRECKAKLAKYSDAAYRCVGKCDIAISEYCSATIQRIAKDNSVIKKGEVIGCYIDDNHPLDARDHLISVWESPGYYGYESNEIKAKQDGRIFWLKGKNEEVKEHDSIYIIGNLYDTREDVMEWYCDSDRVVTKAAMYKAIKK